VSARDRIVRRVAPRVVIAQSQFDTPARIGAAARRRAHRRGRVELYFAFDDPCSAFALLELDERLRDRRVDLVTLPVIARGIPDDPALDRKREYGLVDAQRLFARRDIAVARTAPLIPDRPAFLAHWVAAAGPGPATRRFCVQAMQALWLTDDDPVDRARNVELWHEVVGTAPDDATGPDAVVHNEKRMRRRGGYETPAAWVHGQLFFAHDRLDQIGERLDDLGWTVAR
jgi:2-hydroxychromene-2-carboxylate isomerase